MHDVSTLVSGCTLGALRLVFLARGLLSSGVVFMFLALSPILDVYHSSFPVVLACHSSVSAYLSYYTNDAAVWALPFYSVRGVCALPPCNASMVSDGFPPMIVTQCNATTCAV